MRLTSLAQGGRMTARVLLLVRDMLLSKSESLALPSGDSVSLPQAGLLP
jgi:hypothetical protein